MAWGQLQEVGKHTLVDQIRLCVRCLRLCTRICVQRTSVTGVLRKQLFRLSNKSLVVHQPTLCTLWVRLGHLEKLPTDEHVWPGIITCGGVRRGSGPRGLWRALTFPFTDKSGPQQRGTKSEVAASPLPSRGPKRGRKCYVALAFLGIPNAKHGEQKMRMGPQQRGTIEVPVGLHPASSCCAS